MTVSHAVSQEMAMLPAKYIVAILWFGHYFQAYGSSTIAEEIRKTKSVILGKKKERDGSASVKSRPQQHISRNEVCNCH